MAQKYYLPGYTPPPGISDSNRVKEVQRALGIEVDGVWGPETQHAYNTSRSASVASYQRKHPSPMIANTALTNASKKYGTTFGNPGYGPGQIAKFAAPQQQEADEEYSITPGNAIDSGAIELMMRRGDRWSNPAETNLDRLERGIEQAGFTPLEKMNAYRSFNMLSQLNERNPAAAEKVAEGLLKQGVEQLAFHKPITPSAPELKAAVSQTVTGAKLFQKQQTLWLENKAADSGLGKYEKDRLLAFASTASADQLDKLCGYASIRGLDEPFSNRNWEKTMQYILDGKIGTAPVLYAQTPSISEEAAAHPQIDYPDNFDANTLFSYYYYDDGSYYTDIYYEGKLRDRIPLGKELPKRVKISAVRHPWQAEAEEQLAMTAMMLVKGVPTLGIDTLLGTYQGLSILSEMPGISDLLNLIPTYINNVDEDTIVVTAQIWRPTAMGNDVKYEQLLFQRWTES